MTRPTCALIALLLPSICGVAAVEADEPDTGGEGEPFDVGRFYLGAVYSLGFGSSFLEGDSTPLKEVGVGAGLCLGVKLPTERLWWELGLTAGPFASRDRMGGGAEDEELSADEKQTFSELYGRTMPFYLEVRLLARLKAPHVYWASSILPGFFIHESNYENAEYAVELSNTHLSVSATVRTGPAFVLNDWVEIRVDVAGLELIFEKAFGVLYSPSLAVVLRI